MARGNHPMRARFWTAMPLVLLAIASCVGESPNRPERVVGGRNSNLVKVVTEEEARPILPLSSAGGISHSPRVGASARPRPSASPTTLPAGESNQATLTFEGSFKSSLFAGGTVGTPTQGTAGLAVLGNNASGVGMIYVPGPPAMIAFTDAVANQVRTLDLTTKEVKLLAGSPDRLAEGTTPGVTFFQSPGGIAYDFKRKVLYVADARGRIRRIALAGNTLGLAVNAVDTIAGYGNNEGFRDGKGKYNDDTTIDPINTRATFRRPQGLVCLGDTLYVADTGFHSIRAIDLTSTSFTVTTIAGGKGETASGAPADGAEAVAKADARFNEPIGIAVGIDQASLLSQKPSALYVADYNNHCIRKIDMAADGKVTVLTGKTLQPGSRDGTAAVAQLTRPLAVLADTQGNVFIGEQGNSRLRRADAAGKVVTISGSSTPGSGIGPASTASYGSIVGMTGEINLSTFSLAGLYVYDAGISGESKGPRILKVAE